MNIRDFDIQINLKHEKEIKHFLGLLISTAIFSIVLFDGVDYIWNVPLYKACLIIFPYIAAIPSVISYKKRGKNLKNLFSGNICVQFIIGIGIGLVLAIIMLCISKLVGDIGVGMPYFRNAGSFVYYTLRTFFVVGVTEEFIYRVGIQECLEDLLGRFRIIAPLFSAFLFGLSHIIAGTWTQVVITIILGTVLGYSKFFFKRCTYISVVVAHGTYNYALGMIPYIFMHI